MTLGMDSQNLESYVPVYDVIPDQWENARPFIVEQLKKITNGLNIREIGFYLDEELLSGKAFIPGVNVQGNNSPSQFRQILRKVVDFGALAIGVNSKPHGVVVDANFSLMQLYAAATNSTALIGEPIPNGADTISYTATDIVITVAAAYDRCWACFEYIQEL